MAAPAFDEVLRDLVAGPKALSAPPMAGGKVSSDPIVEFNRAIRTYERQMLRWRTGMITHEPVLRKMLVDAHQFGPDAVTYVRDVQMQQAINILEGEIERLDRSQREVEAVTKAKFDLVSVINPRAATVVRSIKKRMRRAYSEHHNWMVQLYYRLKVMQADFDPESRGGQSFDSADDLLASLDM